MDDKVELSLLNSVNTANPNEDLHSFSETTAPYIENTGIERDGGITNLHLETETYPETGAHFIADDGSVISVIPNGDVSTVKIDDKIIGSVSSYGVEKRFQISGVEDCIITADNTYVTAVINQSDIILTEYDFNNTQLHTRTITFASLGAVSTFFTSLSIVRYGIMHYVDSFEFGLRLGDQVIILQESNPSITFAQTLGSTSILGTSSINTATVYKSWLVVAGDGGRVGSFDGTNWKNYDGTGIGTGPFANGNVVSTNNILSAIVYGSSYVVGAAGGLIASFDGSKWNAYNTSGTGLWNNASVISTDNVTAMQVWTFASKTWLIVGGSAGKLGSYDGTTWYLYSGSTGLYNNATLIGAVQINSISIYNPPAAFKAVAANARTYYADSIDSSSPTILIAGASGRVGSFKYNGGVTWSATTLPVSQTWRAPVYANGVWVLLPAGNTSAAAAYSLNGQTWVSSTLPTAQYWSTPVYANGVWVTLGNSTTVAAYSLNGQTWVSATLPVAQAWTTPIYANGIWMAYSLSNSWTSTAYSADNGQTWTAATLPATRWWGTPVYGNGVWVITLAVGQSGSYAAYSVDNGQTWTAAALPATQYWATPVYNGIWVTVPTSGSGSTAAYSTNGQSWTPASLPASQAYSLTYDNGVWLAFPLGINNIAAYSTSGQSWTSTTLPASQAWSPPIYANNVWVSIPGPSSTSLTAAYSSNNGQTWSTGTLPTSQSWAYLAYGQGVWVAIPGSTAAAAYSLNGQTWVAATLPSTGNWQQPVYANGVWALVTNSSAATAAYSLNGQTWTAATLPSAAFWRPPVYGNSIWVTNSTGTASSISSPIIQSAVYTTTTLPAYPTNNGTVVSTDNIMCTQPWGSNRYVLICGSVGKIGYLAANGAWVNYNNGDPVCSNATALGAVSVNTCSLFGSNIVVAGNSGRVASLDITTNQWKNYDGTGTGTGFYNDGAILGTTAIKASTVYNNSLILANSSGALNLVASNGSYSPFYNDGTKVYVNLLTGLTNNSYLYVYRYENGLYLINLVGNSLNRSYTLNNATKVVTVLNAGWAVPQVYNNLTRHILTTTNPDYTTVSTQIKAMSLVGYTDFINYTGTPVYPNCAYTVSSILSKVAGFGYEDFNFKVTTSSTDIYNYTGPQPYVSAPGLYQIKQSNTDTLINYYGKLTNNLNVPPSKPLEFRAGMLPTLNSTSGVQSFLSVSFVDSGTIDNVGVLLTNVGEFDSTYTPQVVSDSQVLYMYNKKFNIVTLSKSPANVLQKVSTNLYKINTVSALNVVDLQNKTLDVGSSDFNGRCYFVNSATPSTSKTAVALVQYSEYSNSIDVGDKLVSYTTVASNNLEAIGYRIPNLSAAKNYEIDVYVGDKYYTSVLNDGSKLVSPSKADLVYINTSTSPKVIPEAIGQTYVEGTISSPGLTIILEPDYDGYRIGNQLAGNYTVFSLNNGYSYLFDGNFIYAITLDSVGFITNKRKIAPAGGLKFLATAPTEAYFLSQFDNSIYTFEGGQSLIKARRMNRVSDIENAVFNVRDNTLLLNATDQLIWIRDGVLTLNEKLSAQTSLRLYSTEGGIYLGNDTNSWRYTFRPTDTSVVIPLKWRSAFFGITNNIKSIVSEYVCTIYDESKSTHTITGRIFTRDPDNYTQQVETWNVTPDMYTDGGYVTLRLKPATMKSLGSSIALECNDKIIILDVTAQFSTDINAVVEAKRSR